MLSAFNTSSSVWVNMCKVRLTASCSHVLRWPVNTAQKSASSDDDTTAYHTPPRMDASQHTTRPDSDRLATTPSRLGSLPTPFVPPGWAQDRSPLHFTHSQTRESQTAQPGPRNALSPSRDEIAIRR